MLGGGRCGRMRREGKRYSAYMWEEENKREEGEGIGVGGRPREETEGKGHLPV